MVNDVMGTNPDEYVLVRWPFKVTIKSKASKDKKDVLNATATLSYEPELPWDRNYKDAQKDGRRVYDNNKEVSKVLKDHVLASMADGGYLAYITRLKKEGAEVEITADYYQARSPSNQVIHRDTRGETMFVSLTYANAERWPGPDWAETRRVDGRYFAKMRQVWGKQVAKQHMEVIKSFRDTKGIHGTTLEGYTTVTWPDGLFVHATPALGSRIISRAKLKGYTEYYNKQAWAEHMMQQVIASNPGIESTADLDKRKIYRGQPIREGGELIREEASYGYKNFNVTDPQRFWGALPTHPWLSVKARSKIEEMSNKARETESDPYPKLIDAMNVLMDEGKVGYDTMKKIGKAARSEKTYKKTGKVPIGQVIRNYKTSPGYELAAAWFDGATSTIANPGLATPRQGGSQRQPPEPREVGEERSRSPIRSSIRFKNEVTDKPRTFIRLWVKVRYPDVSTKQ
ncbi:MAG: hypothetical protein AAFV90_14155 [Cyanobacteria bacterium J06634_5]